MSRGNFLELLKFRRDAGDPAIDHQIHRRALFTSPSVQNKLISIIADQITAKIIGDIQGQPFTVIADETRDSSNREQLCIAIRYFNRKKSVAEERFMDFTSIESIRGVISSKAHPDS